MILQTLQAMLFTHQGCRKVALVGLGGVGKTQVALQLAFWVKENKPEYSVFWVPALSNASFEQAYAQIMKECTIQAKANNDPKESVRQYLSSKNAGKWLFVVDNADDIDILLGSSEQPGSLYRFLPDNDEGRILFTTRSRKVAVSVAVSDVIYIPELSRKEATSYLEKSLIQKDLVKDKQAVAELLGALTCLPLAITQAAAYLNKNDIPIAKYLRLFRNTDQDMIELMSSEFWDHTRYKQTQNAVASTWLISFRQIRKSDEFAARLLLFIGCIEPKAISRSMLPSDGSEQQLTRAVGTLVGYGFLSRQSDSETLDMHSLVHLATRVWTKEQEAMETTLGNVITHLAGIFPNDRWENRELWRQYLPHAIRVLRAGEGTENEERSHLGYRVGCCLQVDGRIKEALEVLEHVVTIREKTLAEDHPDRLGSQHALALAYQANGQVKEAVKLLEHVVTIQEKTLAEDHPDRLASENLLLHTSLCGPPTRATKGAQAP